MKLILVRHGESAHNRGYKVAGDENNLTAVGVVQAIKLAESLKDQKFDAIYCSPKPRCIQTLDEILRVRDDDMPIYLTSLVGHKKKSENYEHFKDKIDLFLDDLRYDHEPNDTILVISHLSTIEMISYLQDDNKRRLENGQMVAVEMQDDKNKIQK
ncbi:histidine phosphatase family protein [Candidatus Shapirobacteria bacterium]|nr:histidine phosphatase family protein [Candidatus Shapirobacteria bacterium]